MRSAYSQQDGEFSILVSKPMNSIQCIQAAICLHNYLRQTNRAAYCPAGFVDSEDQSGKIKEGEW